MPEHERGRRLAGPALAGQHDDAPTPAHRDPDPVEQLGLPALCLARSGIPPAAADLPGRPAPAAGRWLASRAPTSSASVKAAAVSGTSGSTGTAAASGALSGCTADLPWCWRRIRPRAVRTPVRARFRRAAEPDHRQHEQDDGDPGEQHAGRAAGVPGGLQAGPFRLHRMPAGCCTTGSRTVARTRPPTRSGTTTSTQPVTTARAYGRSWAARGMRRPAGQQAGQHRAIRPNRSGSPIRSLRMK